MPDQNELAKDPGEPSERWREPHGPWKVDLGDGLSEFEAAVLQEVLNTPLSGPFTGDQRICTEAQWYYGPTVGNA